MKNLGLKGLSIVIAVLLSYFVNSEENSTVFTFIAPVEVRNIPAGKVLQAREVPQAHVTIRGPSFVLSRIPAAPPMFRVSASGAIDGVVQLRKSELALPPYVEVVSIQPSELKLDFDDLAEVKVGIKAPILGPVGSDYKVDSVVVTPESVTLKGAAREIRRLAVIQTEPVEVRDVKKTVLRSVPLRLPSDAVEASVKEVSVEVRIVPIESRREFERVPVEVRSVAGENYALTPPVVGVEIRGRREEIEKLDRDHVIPYVRLGKDYREREVVEVGVELPAGLSVARVDPPRVEVIRSVTGKRAEKKSK
jgi:YbbR domain-containing protein